MEFPDQEDRLLLGSGNNLAHLILRTRTRQRAKIRSLNNNCSNILRNNGSQTTPCPHHLELRTLSKLRYLEEPQITLKQVLVSAQRLLLLQLSVGQEARLALLQQILGNVLHLLLKLRVQALEYKISRRSSNRCISAATTRRAPLGTDRGVVVLLELKRQACHL